MDINDPPPAPTSAKSIACVFNKYPAPVRSLEPAKIPPPTSKSSARAYSPRSTIDAFAVVPPISKVMRFPSSAFSASRRAPTTPPAGPDSIMFIGSSAAVSTGVKPPFDCINKSSALMPDAIKPASSVSRYSDTIGLTYALIVVVDVRSYSLISGNTSALMENGRFGASRLIIDFNKNSCSGFAYELIKQTAIDSTLSSINFLTARSPSSIDRGLTTFPVELIRSSTVTRRNRSTKAGGLVQARSYNLGILRVRISRTSRNPLDPISPVFAPLRSSMALEATVVPWRTCLTIEGVSLYSSNTASSPFIIARA